MTRREWKQARKHPDHDEFQDDQSGIEGATIFWSIILFIAYAFICYEMFGY